MLKSILSAAAALALVSPALAQTAIDGDTIRIGAERFRLWGIDAPEARQTCADGWPAGRVASQALAALMQGRVVSCEPRGHDRYGRTVALCRADGRDLGQQMVRAGLALAFVRYSVDYVKDEATAKAGKLGVHAHPCDPPWQWRAASH